MTDNELGGAVLKTFYDLRHQKPVIQLPAIAAAHPNEESQRMSNICDQLAQHDLIKWKRMEGIGGSDLGGMGSITAHGVDVIEGTQRPPTAITFHDHSVSVRGSSHVQIGNANIQNATVDIDKLIVAVDHSHASDAEKTEAKSLLQRLAQNPLVQWAWTQVFGAGTS
jgi:hypothetical protein